MSTCMFNVVGPHDRQFEAIDQSLKVLGKGIESLQTERALLQDRFKETAVKINETRVEVDALKDDQKKTGSKLSRIARVHEETYKDIRETTASQNATDRKRDKCTIALISVFALSIIVGIGFALAGFGVTASLLIAASIIGIPSSSYLSEMFLPYKA